MQRKHFLKLGFAGALVFAAAAHAKPELTPPCGRFRGRAPPPPCGIFWRLRI